MRAYCNALSDAAGLTCRAEVTACHGDGVFEGNCGGPRGPFLECVRDCECDDACGEACGADVSAECVTCMQTVQT